MKLEIIHKDASDDAVFAIKGLGLFVNGESRDITDEEAEAFEAANGYPISDISTEYIKIGGKVTKKSEDNEGVPVEESDAELAQPELTLVDGTEAEGGDN